MSNLTSYGTPPVSEGTRLPDWTMPRPIENPGSVGNLAQIHARENAGHDTALTFDVLRVDGTHYGTFHWSTEGWRLE